MPYRKRFSRQTMGKRGIKKAGTFIGNMGPGSVPNSFEVLVTEGGARSTSGAETSITAGRTTGETVNVGDVVKYVNLMMEVHPRLVTIESTGVLEWAFVCQKEIDPEIPITNVGTLSLMTIAMNMYRGDCIFTGCFPVGVQQPNCQPVSLKIPKSRSTIKLGDQWFLYSYFRTTSSTETGTSSVKIVHSFAYKAYQ